MAAELIDKRIDFHAYPDASGHFGRVWISIVSGRSGASNGRRWWMSS